jgi:hypothetical protein
MLLAFTENLPVIECKVTWMCLYVVWIPRDFHYKFSSCWQEALCISIANTSHLMLFSVMVGLSANHMKNISILHGKMQFVWCYSRWNIYWAVSFIYIYIILIYMNTFHTISL